MSSRLVLQAADKGEPPLSATATVRVQVVDVNDNSPTIPHMEPVVIAESRSDPVCVPHAGPAAPGSPEMFCPTADRPAGHTVAQVTANDVDLSSTITYSLSANGSASCPFAIDRYSGVLSLTRALDHEEQAEYRLTVLASDSLHQTSGEVRVQVLDLNDNAPVFIQDCYQVRVPCPSRDGRMDRWTDGWTRVTSPVVFKVDVSELAAADTLLVTVSATDRDSGANGEISYRLLSSPLQGFSIQADSGKTLWAGQQRPLLCTCLLQQNLKDNSSFF